MNISYYFSSHHKAFSSDANAGLAEVEKLLGRMIGLGITVTRVDTSDFSEEELFAEYAKASTVAMYRHSKNYSVRRVFGTQRRGGSFFGREVPALVVFDDGTETVTDVYPHREGNRISTIHDFQVAVLGEPDRYTKSPASVFTLNLESVKTLSRLRRQVFGKRTVQGDSTEIIRQAREAR